ncbi:mannose-1-phosphate guanylyltransferase/mannose-6-phosphate isomerase [Magnetospira thiophila]
MIVPVILSGGSGTRLWPLSRQAYPKQFLPLLGTDSLFQATVLRVSCLADYGNPLVVCNEAHRFLVAEQLKQLGVEAAGILLEPIGRNTAPAVACAALQACATDEEALLLVMPSDHVIGRHEAFVTAAAAAARAAAKGALVTFGVVPGGPETGYGYIRADRKGQSLDEAGDLPVWPVKQFVEKPDLQTAEKYVSSGDYFWNSGMFMFRARSYLDELERHAPQMIGPTRDSVNKAVVDLDFIRLQAKAFAECPSNSIDYAVMEKTDRAVVVPLDAEWSDVGSWSSLADALPADAGGNVTSGDVLLRDSKNSYLRSENRLIAGIGLTDMVVIETADAVLVADKSQVQEVKEIVAQLKAAGRPEETHHVRVYRPWGSYETISECQRFKVKRILVNPGAALSLQLHHHRAEHWVVVAGTARVTRDKEELLLTEDQSVYLPLGTLHRLENPGKIPLEIIEVQTGSYLEEDDIVRFSDVYGREKIA